MKIGSLFSGYGGLEMGVQSVIGGEVAWHVEFDAAPSRILEHRHPGIPNYGDITTMDWSAVEPVDVLTGGFPCQDVSLAGLRRGLKEGTRSGLWSEFARAIGHLRPGLVVIENVRGLLSAVAAGPVESDPWSVGDGPVRPSLRALGAVLGDLADLGYDARWGGFRAADAGAPHGRFRVFILAHPFGERWGQGWTESARRSGGSAIERSSSSTHADSARFDSVRRNADGRCGENADGHDTEPTSPAHSSGEQGSVRDGDDVCPRCGAIRREPTAGTSAATDADSERLGWRTEEHPRVTLQPATARDHTAPAYTTGRGRDGRPQVEVGEQVKRATATRPGGADWGPYGGAIGRWERSLGRVAPAPTEPTGKGGAQRLSPAFVEWMMGLPLGWLTAPEVGLTRAQQLKALGNGVVPQQAALAVRTLLEAEAVAA